MFIASRHFETIDDFINLELSTSKYQGNMTKFHYNPISLTPITREFFDHLQTLYWYTKDDNQFKEDLQNDSFNVSDTVFSLLFLLQFLERYFTNEKTYTYNF